MSSGTSSGTSAAVPASVTTAAAPDRLPDFLRHRRSVADPAALGTATYGARRVPGLRREELAEAAGVSLTYYTRLEQGLATNPSDQVLDALARALRLDQVERAHLFRLAGASAPPMQASPARLQALLDAMPDVAGIAL